jgi:hypothetical protein
MKIQGAVNAALTGDTINVAAGTYKENVKIDKSVALNGAGSTKTIVDGNKAGSVFGIGTVNPNVNVALSGMRIQNGAAQFCGGGIVNTGKLTVAGCTISGNQAMYFGGGIANYGGNYGATVTVKGSTISGNTAGSSSTTGWGGGIYTYGSTATVTGSTTITGSTISGNTAYCGGGIGGEGFHTTTVTNSIISGNTAKSGGGIFEDSGQLTVTGSTISGNTASNGDGGGILWGGVGYSNGNR